MEDKRKNYRKKAVALKYNADSGAPKVVAKGEGFVAQKIFDEAIKSDVPIYEDKTLVEELEKIDIGTSIPTELYEVVAKVLVFISDIDRRESLRKNAQNK